MNQTSVAQGIMGLMQMVRTMRDLSPRDTEAAMMPTVDNLLVKFRGVAALRWL